MNQAEALRVVAAMQLVDPFARARTVDENVAIAEMFAATLPTTPESWAMEQIRAGVRKGKVLSLAELASAWQAEARRRIESVEVPEAPPAIEADPNRWRLWDKARRQALLRGATPELAAVLATQIEANPSTARLWEAARLEALRHGATEEQAASSASRRLTGDGLTALIEPPVSSRAGRTLAEIKAEVRARVADWERRQAADQADDAGEEGEAR